MKNLKYDALPSLLSPLQGGYYTGLIELHGELQAIIRAPKAEGRSDEMPWGKYGQLVTGADSFADSAANTLAMAESGSKLAKWALGLRIDGRNDWALPALDVLELMHRHGKPGTRKNYCYMRSGMNTSSVPVGHPYVPNFPEQAALALFQAGGAEASDEDVLWSSTQSDADYAWYQYFNYGFQDYYIKSNEWRGWAVRTVPVIR